MKYFDKDFIAFFKELSRNNSKVWFDANKARFEKSVKEPFSIFVEDMIMAVRKLDRSVDITSRDAIFRLHRDVRFSNDKTPYKTYMAAIISGGGRKDKTVPGVYLAFGPDKIQIYGGAHMVEKDMLYRIRKYIAGNLSRFNKVINDKEFTKRFGSVLGDKHKRVPPEFKEVAEKQPLIANKAFYYGTELESKTLLDAKLADRILTYFKAGKPFNDFMKKAMGI